jgi:hypothetical protein
MHLLSKILATMYFFVVFLIALPASAQDKKEFLVGDFTPEKAIELLTAEPLDEAVTYTKDDKGQVCEYRNKTVKFLVRYCDNPRKGVLGGTIIHSATKQAVTYFIELTERADLDTEKEYIVEQFTWRTFSFIYPYVESSETQDPNYKPNSPICEVGFFVTLSPLSLPTRQNWSRCDNKFASEYHEKWEESGKRMREEVNDPLFKSLAKLHISKFSVEKKK